LGIVGPNGAGKSTLLGLCTGALAPDAGTGSIGDSVVFASIDQRRSALHAEHTVLHEVAGQNAWVRLGERMQHVEGFLEQFLFPGAQKHALVGSLSGGERNRVLLARLLCAGGNVLVLDEPTNDLDLETLRALEEALVAFPGCALVVSHDRWFLDRVATRVVHLDGAGGVTVRSGDLSGLLGELATRRPGPRAATHAAPVRTAGATADTNATGAQRATAAAGAAASAGRGGAATERPKRLAPWEERECDALPDRIAALEAELAATDVRLAAPELYQGPIEELQRVTALRARLAAEVEQLTQRWEALESRR
jgi:ATP-binding cassette subfamily F protein uup